MADKTATVKIQADASGFRKEVKDTAKGVEATLKAAAKAVESDFSKSLSAGIKGGTDELKKMGAKIKDVASQFGPLIGFTGVGALAKSAIDAESQFRKLSFTLGAGTGKLRDWHALQKQASDSAIKWSQSSADLGKAMETVFNTVGDADFASGTIDEIAKAAQASGHSVGTIAPLVAELNRQFGLTADQVPDALASVLSLGARGGMSIEELGANLGKMGRLAGVAGLQGAGGMRTLLAVVNGITAASGTAEGSVEKMNMVFAKLTGGKADIEKALGIKLTGGDAIENLEKVLKATGGDAGKLTKVFGEQGATIAQAFGGDVENFRSNLDAASKSALDASNITDQANENNKSAQAGLSRAIETMKTAFENPEMQTAIARLAENLPAMADAVSKVMKLFAENPVLGAGVLTGGVMRKGGLGALFAGAQQGAEGAKGLGAAATSAATQTMSFSSSLGGAIAANLLMALAVGGATAAVDQLTKFVGELKGAERDREDQREEAMAAAEREGKSVGIREMGTGEGLIDATAEDLLYGTGREILTRDPKTGKVVARKEKRGQEWMTEGISVPSQNAEIPDVVPLGGPEAPGYGPNWSFERDRLRHRLFERGVTGAYDLSDEDLRSKANGMGITADGAAKPQQQAIGREVAAAMADRTLNVKVTNASDLRAPAGGTPPPPGYAPR